jgi:hypothetical protein
MRSCSDLAVEPAEKGGGFGRDLREATRSWRALRAARQGGARGPQRPLHPPQSWFRDHRDNGAVTRPLPGRDVPQALSTLNILRVTETSGHTPYTLAGLSDQVSFTETSSIGTAFLTTYEARQVGEQRRLLAVVRTRVPFRSAPLQSCCRGPPPAAPESSHLPPRSPIPPPRHSPRRSPDGCLPP